jgi:hypothetical protein
MSMTSRRLARAVHASIHDLGSTYMAHKAGVSDRPHVHTPLGPSEGRYPSWIIPLVLVFGGVRVRKVVAVTAAREVSSDNTDGALWLV